MHCVKFAFFIYSVGIWTACGVEKKITNFHENYNYFKWRFNAKFISNRKYQK